MQYVILLVMFIVSQESWSSDDVPNLNKPGNEYCFETGEVCIDTEPRIISGELASPDCWEYTKEYTCYSYPQNTDCSIEENNLVTVNKFDQVYTPLLTNIDGTGLQIPQAWKEEKEIDLTCEIDTGFDCTDWYLTEDDKYAKTCYTEEPMECQPEGCLVLSEECTSFANGVCVAESVSFTCDASSVCTGSGIDAVSELGTGIGEYVASSMIAEVVTEYSEVNQVTGEVTLFSGEAESCKSMTSKGEDVWTASGGVCAIVASFTGQVALATLCGAFADIAASNELRCCQSDPSDISGRVVDLGYCDEGDIELAVARKTNRAVQVGPPVKNECVCAQGGVLLTTPIDWIGPRSEAFFACSHLCKNPYIPTTLLNEHVTMDRREQWCKFNDPLAKIIQEQGREQIEAIINSPISTKEELVLNPSYISSGLGRWSSNVNAADNIVRFWEWDNRCSNPEESYDAQSKDGVYCPSSPSQVVAVCSNPEGGCGPIPNTPSPIDTDWDLQLLLHGDESQAQFINKYTRANGQCRDVDLDGVMDDCEWNLFALPAGVGSQSIVSIDMNWMPHMPMGDENAPEFQWINRFSTSTLEIQTMSSTKMNSQPAPPRARIRQIGAGNWTEISLNQGAETEFIDPSGKVITFSGDCNKYACNYIVSSVHNLTFKPWSTYTPNQTHRYTILRIDLLVGSYTETKGISFGEKYEPHCEGFTLDEFMALDISKMDLSEYLDTVNEEAREKIRSLLID